MSGCDRDIEVCAGPFAAGVEVQFLYQAVDQSPVDLLGDRSIGDVGELRARLPDIVGFGRLVDQAHRDRPGRRGEQMQRAGYHCATGWLRFTRQHGANSCTGGEHFNQERSSLDAGLGCLFDHQPTFLSTLSTAYRDCSSRTETARRIA